MILQGKKLRVLAAGKMFAYASTCQIAAQVQVIEASDKDAPDSWAEKGVGSKSCIITSEAYVYNKTVAWSAMADKDVTVEGHAFHSDGKLFHMRPGDNVRFSAYNASAYLIDTNDNKIVESQSDNYTAYDYMTVMVVASDSVQISATLYRGADAQTIYAEDVPVLMKAGVLLDVEVAQAGWDSNHIKKESVFVKGKARLTKFDFSAQIGEASKYSVELTCSGGVTLGNDAGTVAVLDVGED